MDSLATKACSQCTAVKELTREFFYLKKDSPDGFRSECRACTKDARSVEKTRELKALKVHDRIVKRARKLLEKPEELAPHTLHKMNQIVNGDEKKRAKLAAKVDEQRKAKEAARIATAANPALERVKAMGSALFGPDGTWLHESESGQATQLARFEAVLPLLTAPSDALARDYVQSVIDALRETIDYDVKRKALLAEQEQERLDGDAVQRALRQIHDQYLDAIRAAKSVNQKNLLRQHLWKMRRASLAIAETSTEKDDTGASKALVATACAKEFDKLARTLYGGTQTMADTDTLQNIQSRQDAANASAQWLEDAEIARQKYWSDLKQSDAKRYEAESKSLLLQVKGTGMLAQLERDAARKLKRENPEEYRRRALLALQPRKVTPDVIVYRVPTDEGVVLMWPDGRLVKHGGDVQHAEIVKDYRGWYLNPSPLGAEIEDGPAQPMELIQDPMICDSEGYPTWRWVPEGSMGVHEQQPDGSFKRTDTPSPWGKATPIVFKDADPPASPEHTVFKFGGWWTPAQVAAANSTEWSDTPPAILPPLQRVVADCVAVEPPPNAAQLERMNRPAQTVWQRHERKRRQQAEQEAALLRGTYVWNFPS